MPSPAGLVVVVLAAGKSRRFGAADKLLSFYHGKPLAKHVSLLLQNLPYVQGCVVVRKREVAALFNHSRLTPIYIRSNDEQSISLRAGLHFARQKRASHVLLLLADMPNLTQQTLQQFIGHKTYSPVMARSGKASLPPAIIPRCLFSRLERLYGDRGAGFILRQLPNINYINIAEEEAVDIDQNKDKSGYC